MKIKIPKKIERSAHRTVLKVKKYSPEILIVIGMAGAVASGVMACKATTKASTIINNAKEEMEKANQVAENTDAETYSEEDRKSDHVIVCSNTALDLVKIYAPSVILGAISLTCVMASHNIMRKRNVAIAAAYATIDKGFKEYRGRVIERFGKGVDRELKYNIKAQEIEEVIKDSKGKEKTIKKTMDIADPNEYSDYARIYDDGCIGWCKDPEHNLAFLKSQQSYANDRLKRCGYLFLNDVYEMLGFPRTKSGQCVGWIYDEENPVGDNFVDFGIFDINKPRARDFVNGYERCIVLDFNVDGYILDFI